LNAIRVAPPDWTHLPDDTYEERKFKEEERIRWINRLKQAHAIGGASGELPKWFHMPDRTVEERKAREKARLEWFERRRQAIGIAKAQARKQRMSYHLYSHRTVRYQWFFWRTPYGYMWFRAVR